MYYIMGQRWEQFCNFFSPFNTINGFGVVYDNFLNKLTANKIDVLPPLQTHCFPSKRIKGKKKRF